MTEKSKNDDADAAGGGVGDVETAGETTAASTVGGDTTSAKPVGSDTMAKVAVTPNAEPASGDRNS